MNFSKINNSISKAFETVDKNKTKIEEIKSKNGDALSAMNKAIHEFLEKEDPEWEEEYSHYNYGKILFLLNEMGDDTEFDDLDSFKAAIEEFTEYGLDHVVRFFNYDCEDVTKTEFDGDEITFEAEIDGHWMDGTINVKNGEVEVDKY